MKKKGYISMNSIRGFFILLIIINLILKNSLNYSTNLYRSGLTGILYSFADPIVLYILGILLAWSFFANEDSKEGT
ncbi:MAG: hypothetical protein KQ78_00431 [Candidatus Izimaplasma bacterium HR2]|nr:MAG: hypothetical protein KQ78_00431 [Candidatus Izimaplasma bacterium HR2]